MTNETPASKDAQLAALRVSVPDSGDAVLSPPLFGDETEYTAKVASSATSVTVRVTPAHPRATVEYLDTEGTAHVDADVEADGHQVTLEDGVTTLEVKVTAEDGRTTQTYTVDIARNQVPSITLVSPAPGEEGADPANGFAVAVNENAFAVATLGGHDADGDRLTWTRSGDDGARFLLASNTADGTALVGFGRPLPDYENPTDSDKDNEYRVTFEVSDGTQSATVELTVTVGDVDEPPAAPEAPRVSAAADSTTSLDVSWTAPGNTGPAITSYDVQVREGASGTWLDGPQDVAETSTTVTALTTRTGYQVRVRATNDEGDGDWSEAGSGTTATPTPPQGLVASPGNGESTLSWSAPCEHRRGAPPPLRGAVEAAGRHVRGLDRRRHGDEPHGREPRQRHGFAVFGGRGTATPHAGLSRSGGSQTRRLGQRLELGPSRWTLEGASGANARTWTAGYGYRVGGDLDLGLDLGVDATRREGADGGASGHGLTLRRRGGARPHAPRPAALVAAGGAGILARAGGGVVRPAAGWKPALPGGGARGRDDFRGAQTVARRSHHQPRRPRAATGAAAVRGASQSYTTPIWVTTFWRMWNPIPSAAPITIRDPKPVRRSGPSTSTTAVNSIAAVDNGAMSRLHRAES